jgi:hypothetical protein
MFKIDTGDSTTTEPTRPAADTPGFFSTTLRTTVTDWWLNMMQNEVINAVIKFGLTPDKTNDNQLGLAIAAAVAQGKSDITYIGITSHPTGITQSTVNTYNYVIADFLGGTGLVTADIRGFYISCSCGSGVNDLAGIISAEFPDGATHIICEAHVAGGSATQANALVAYVPIKPGQTDFDLEIAFVFAGSGSFTIDGCAQIIASA